MEWKKQKTKNGQHNFHFSDHFYAIYTHLWTMCALSCVRLFTVCMYTTKRNNQPIRIRLHLVERVSESRLICERVAF